MSEMPRPDSRADVRSIVARVRRFSRRRSGRLVLATVLIGAAVQVVSGLGRDAAETERAWGEIDVVWVATAPVAAGAVITGDTAAPQRLPRIAVPVDAVFDSPLGRRAAVPLAPGEVLREARLGAGGPLAVQLRADEGAIALPSGAPHLRPGDLVDLHALLTGDRVAAAARVLEVEDGIAIVAVADDDLGPVVRTFTTGDVVAVVVG